MSSELNFNHIIQQDFNLDLSERRRNIFKLKKLQKRIKKSRSFYQKNRKNYIIKAGTEISNLGIILLETLLIRSEELFRSATRNLKSDANLSAYNSVRCHYEVTATIGYLLEKLKNYENKKDRQKILHVIKKLLLGTNISGASVTPIHVCDRIRSVDKINLFGHGEKIFEEFYSELSEYTHVNYSAIHISLRFLVNNNVFLFDYDKNLQHKLSIARNLLISHTRFTKFYEECERIIDSCEISMPYRKKWKWYDSFIQQILVKYLIWPLRQILMIFKKKK